MLPRASVASMSNDKNTASNDNNLEHTNAEEQPKEGETTEDAAQQRADK